ncbi:hypothetical protein ACFVZM_06675 [Streptomyces sioyaensis]|uniref:hypothetical protein n=1 Tax=Streptomyces sioyaensis TaxID=67364 RepID=UPI0036D165CA
MSDERRERYAAAIQRAATGGYELSSILPEVYDATDAAMAVADEELDGAHRALAEERDVAVRVEAENVRLRAELAATVKAKQENDERFQLRPVEAEDAIERVRAAARKAKDSGNVWDLDDLISAALDGTS